jgi:hypothetical protein
MKPPLQLGRQGRPDGGVKGHSRERNYRKDGETKTVRDFVVEDLKIR